MEPVGILTRFGAALFIGFLIGLQREYSHGKPGLELAAGVRTFAILGIIGCLAAMITDILTSPWIFVAVLLTLSVFFGVAYFISAWKGMIGQTTEMAAVVTVLLGALCYWDHLALAAAVAVALTVLLSMKTETQTFARNISREDVYATLKFAVISVIILPVLPNQTYGSPPWDVLNPYKIWLMVVLISGVSFLGYVLIKFVGTEKGTGLTGFMGGLVSSTAVTASFSQRSQSRPEMSRTLALGIVIAWTVMFLRVMVLVVTLNQALFNILWLPVLLMAGSALIACAILFISYRQKQQSDITISNPFNLGPAVKFGAMYAFILIMFSLARTYLGNAGVYISSTIAGLADVDAITLSLSNLAGKAGSVDLFTAARGILLAMISNTLVKGSMVMLTGAVPLRKTILPALVLILITGIVSIIWIV